MKPWSIYVEKIRGVDGYALREIALGFCLSFSISASLALLREIQPIITQFDFDHVSPSLTKCRRRRSNLGSVASQQQAPEKRPQLAISAWRIRPIAPMHHRGDSVLGVDCRRFGRSGVVKRGQAWWMPARWSVLEGRGSKGLRPPCKGVGLPLIPFENFGAQKNLAFAPSPKCPRIGEKACCLRFLDAG